MHQQSIYFNNIQFDLTWQYDSTPSQRRLSVDIAFSGHPELPSMTKTLDVDRGKWITQDIHKTTPSGNTIKAQSDLHQLGSLLDNNITMARDALREIKHDQYASASYSP